MFALKDVWEWGYRTEGWRLAEEERREAERTVRHKGSKWWWGEFRRLWRTNIWSRDFSPYIVTNPLHLSLTHTLPLFTPTYTHVYAAGMPMRCEQSEHEAMQQFDCSGSLPRQTQTPQRQWALLEAFCEGKTKCLTLITDRLLKFRNTLITLKERVRLFPFRFIFFDVQCPLPYRF